MAESRRPVGHGHASAVACDQSANANQTERRRSHQNGKAVQPGIISASRHQLKKNAAATSAASAMLPEQFDQGAGTSSSKSTVFLSLSLTLIFCDLAPILPIFWWNASMVYSPAGKLEILNEPSLSVTAKYG